MPVISMFRLGNPRFTTTFLRATDTYAGSTADVRCYCFTFCSVKSGTYAQAFSKQSRDLVFGRQVDLDDLELEKANGASAVGSSIYLRAPSCVRTSSVDVGPL